MAREGGCNERGGGGDAVRADITEWAIIEPVSSDSLDTVHASLEVLCKANFPD